MFDFLFLKYETTVIAAIIGATIGLFILETVKNAVKSFLGGAGRKAG